MTLLDISKEFYDPLEEILNREKNMLEENLYIYQY